MSAGRSRRSCTAQGAIETPRGVQVHGTTLAPPGESDHPSSAAFAQPEHPEGAAAAQIVEFAARGAFDLIIMGTHGRTGMSHFLMGSTAERVVRIAPCPVLTVKKPGYKQAA